MQPAITGPIALYNNLPIQHFYQPKRHIISDVILGRNTIVTTLGDMFYVVGQEIRLLIPTEFGCRQLNDVKGYVLEILASNQVLTSIDSSQNVDNFISSIAPTKPEILAIGDVNSGQVNTNGRNDLQNNIPGSFINTSPREL